MKKCSACGETKPLDQFSPNRGRCRPCRVAETMARYRGDPEVRERMKEQARQWHRENEDRAYLGRRLRIAEAKGRLPGRDA